MSADRPLVSVVTANFNGALYLQPAIRSVLDQTLSSLELIVVDDRSTDASVAIVEQEAARDPRVRLIVQDRNGGPGAARNRALDAARGRWIAVFDSDDLMAPDRLERLVERAEGEGADIVVDNLMVFQDGSDEPWRPLLSGREFAEPRWIELAEYIASNRLYAKRPGTGYLKPLFSADCLSGVRYREALRIGEDYDLVARLLARGCRLRLEPSALYRYRQRAGSISHVLKREHIEQMIVADAALGPELARQPAPVRRAQEGRAHSLQRGLVYDRVIEALKARRLDKALAAGVVAPSVWPLLAMPLTARLKRLAARLKAPPAPIARSATA